tara:strand:- start:268 stop:816 length:549 start_codon:yes stop_codon:yes gene_type:complete
MLRLWIGLLIAFLLSLSVWGTFFVHETEHKIAIFGIVGILITTVTSVFSITINNKDIKERELELIQVKEKQKVFAHFYNVYFELLKKTKKGQGNNVTDKIVNDLMEFKKGFLNWGSIKLIKDYLEFDSNLQNPEMQEDPFYLIRIGDKFLKDLRRDLGFNDSEDVNIMSIILDNEARKQMSL